MADPLVIIGRSEELELVDQALVIPAKIDTGAFRSAIHFKSVEVLEQNGNRVLHAELLGHPSSPKVFTMDFEEYESVGVKNSFGVREVRYKIRLRVKLGTKVFWTSFTLADRSNNLMPILVGREILTDRFIVDVSKTSINRKQLREIYNQNASNNSETKREV